MKRVKKRIVVTLATVLCLFAIPMSVFAASGSYSSTYNMTGGLYVKQTWDAKNTPTFKVSNSNGYSVVDGEIYVMLQKKGLLGYSTKSDGTLPARKGGSCTLKGDGSGNYRIYLRQLTGDRMTGDITVSWSW